MNYLENLQADVLGCIDQARQAVMEQEVADAIQWLSKAVSIYEENPSAVHQPESQFGDLLRYIQAMLGACDDCEFEQAAVELEVRASALQAALH